jgi:hypothetical protein
MIVVNLKGGLGNQMFQYALGYSLARRHQQILRLDVRYLRERRSGKDSSGGKFVARDYALDSFGIEANSPSRVELIRFGVAFGSFRVRYLMGRILDRLGCAVVAQRTKRFEARVFSRGTSLYVDGYWQSEKYFEDVARELRATFNFDRVDQSGEVAALAGQISQTNSICLIVRRGDYVGSATLDVVGPSYFERAMARMAECVEGGTVFVFTDDGEWCQRNLRFDRPWRLIDDRAVGNQFFSKFFLMTRCRHFIIPNSTFAWWAAWLGEHPAKVVIAPETWSAAGADEDFDVIPASWIKV